MHWFGTNLFIHEIGASMVEVLANGTAVLRNNEVKTQTEQLPPQAIIRDRDTFIDATLQPMSRDLERH